MLGETLDLLRCPHCGSRVRAAGSVVRCDAGHSFDVARQGYLNLLPGDAKPGTGDTAEMVRAREAFLGAGHYEPIALAVAHACRQVAVPGCVVDVGAGTGYYLAAVLDRLPGRTGVALDVSKHALRRAARAHPRIGAIGCDAWRPLPLRDGVAAVALNVFAPREAAEIARVLAPGGHLVVVTPTDRHLQEAIDSLGLLTVDERKRERLERKLGGRFELTDESTIELELDLGRGDLAALVAMGPSAWHRHADDVRGRIESLPERMAVTASVRLSLFRRHP